jgi:hypothetical protein
MGAVGHGSLAVDTDRDIDRAKVLQMTLLPMMRAVLAVFCQTLQQKIVS